MIPQIDPLVTAPLTPPLKIPFIDLRGEYRTVAADWRAALDRVGESGRFIQAGEVAALEAEIAAHVGVREAVAMGSGSDALVLALAVLDLAPGDEVITTPFSFVATVEAILRVGARPVFADIEPDSFNLDPAAVAACIGPRTRAILPVHLYGRMCAMDRLLALADRHGLALVEDAAQSFGACWRGRGAGSLGLLGCYSFYPTKVLGGFGDGGMVVTDDAALAARLRRLRNHGLADGGHRETGLNSRLDEVQAALLRLKLAGLAQAIARRRQLAANYHRWLAGSELALPPPGPPAAHVHGLYTVRHPHRDRLRQTLARVGVESRVYYPRLLPAEELCAGLGHPPGALPVAGRAAREVLSLPLYPGLDDDHQRALCRLLRALPERD